LINLLQQVDGTGYDVVGTTFDHKTAISLGVQVI
jgi:hypothetical protein